MEEKSEPQITAAEPQITAEKIHQMFIDMNRDYGAMMTAIPGKEIGENQSDLMPTTPGLDDDIPTFCETVKEGKSIVSEMLAPSNSCGFISNQVCALFLGAAAATQLSTQTYHILNDNGQNLRQAIPNDKDVLLRFEVDKRKDFQAVEYMDLNTLDQLNHALNQKYAVDPADDPADNPIKRIGDSIFSNDVLVVINSALCSVAKDPATGSFQAVDLTPDEDEKKRLSSILTTFKSDADEPLDVEVAYSSGLGSHKGKPQENLIDFAFEQYAKRGLTWKSTHSFTTFIPAAAKGGVGAGMPHQYQAYIGRHTLQQWAQAPKRTELLALGLDGYIQQFSRLATARGPDTKAIDLSLFSLGGDDERRLLGNHTAVTAGAFRVKYKVAPVNIQQTYNNLCELQRFCESYPGSTAAERVTAYENEAKGALYNALEILRAPSSALSSAPTSPI